MARNSEKITIAIDGGTREVVISELRIREIMKIANEFSSDLSLSKIASIAKDYAPHCVSLGYEEILDLSPSQANEIFVCFMRVNKDFFQTLEKMGVLEMLRAMWGTFKADLWKSYQVQSVPAT